jgi:hypothetical protein
MKASSDFLHGHAGNRRDEPRHCGRLAEASISTRYSKSYSAMTNDRRSNNEFATRDKRTGPCIYHDASLTYRLDTQCVHRSQEPKLIIGSLGRDV